MLEKTASPAGALDAMAMDVDIAGNEGVNVNYTSRIRVHYLVAQHQSLIAQMQFADAKAGVLMTVIGLLAVKGPLPSVGMEITLASALPIAAAILSVMALAIAILAILPRYPPRAVRRQMLESDRFSWPALADTGLAPGAYAEFMRTAEVSQLVVSLARSNAACAGILLRKYKAMRLAIYFGLAQFAVLIAAIVKQQVPPP